jgi:hypothetical protein
MVGRPSDNVVPTFMVGVPNDIVVPTFMVGGPMINIGTKRRCARADFRLYAVYELRPVIVVQGAILLNRQEI